MNFEIILAIVQLCTLPSGNVSPGCFVEMERCMAKAPIKNDFWLENCIENVDPSTLDDKKTEQNGGTAR